MRFCCEYTMSDAPKDPFSPLSIVVCPLTHAPLRLDASGQFLVTASGIKYPLKDGIPILLPTAAIQPTATGVPAPALTPPACNS